MVVVCVSTEVVSKAVALIPLLYVINRSRRCVDGGGGDGGGGLELELEGVAWWSRGMILA